jgi:hypothetical protein
MIPMASIALTREGPRMLTIMMASRMLGKASITSMSRMRPESV